MLKHPILIAAIWLGVFVFWALPALYADTLFPPSYLTAISDQDAKIPLFWFKPNPDTLELAYNDGLMYNHVYVSPEWHHNCLALFVNQPLDSTSLTTLSSTLRLRPEGNLSKGGHG